MTQQFQHSIKLWLFNGRIIFNQLLCCSCSTTLIIFNWRAKIKLFDGKFDSGYILYVYETCSRSLTATYNINRPVELMR